MVSSPHLSRNWVRLGSLFLLSTAVLFLGFYRNQWNVVREKKFKEFQLDSESLVIARMVESRQHGLLAENGLLGWGDADPLNLNASDYDHQYQVYLSGQGFHSYSVYKSASGAQALFFGILRQLSPFSPAVDLRNFRALEAVLFAAAVSLFVTWTHREFGVLPALFVLITTVMSQWMTLFGRNLFYFIWASFLPLGWMLLFLAHASRATRSTYPGLAAVSFGGILFKCLANGYDFIIPALSMPLIPLMYYAVRDRWARAELLRRAAVVCMSLLAAVAISLVILALQLQISEGSFLASLGSIISTFGRRTYADPALFPSYAASLEANPWSVLWTYLSEDTAMASLGLRFLDIIIVFAGITGLYLLWAAYERQQVPELNKTLALISATWLSILSPVAWFIIFKGQAYVHTHTNYLAWHMPFTLFGYAMCAQVAWSIGSDFLRRVRRPPASSHR